MHLTNSRATALPRHASRRVLWSTARRSNREDRNPRLLSHRGTGRPEFGRRNRKPRSCRNHRRRDGVANTMTKRARIGSGDRHSDQWCISPRPGTDTPDPLRPRRVRPCASWISSLLIGNLSARQGEAVKNRDWLPTRRLGGDTSATGRPSMGTSPVVAAESGQSPRPSNEGLRSPALRKGCAHRLNTRSGWRFAVVHLAMTIPDHFETDCAVWGQPCQLSLCQIGPTRITMNAPRIFWARFSTCRVSRKTMSDCGVESRMRWLTSPMFNADARSEKRNTAPRCLNWSAARSRLSVRTGARRSSGLLRIWPNSCPAD